MKRKLTKDEKEVCEAQIKNINESMDFDHYKLQHANLEVNGGLRCSFERQLKELKKKVKEATENLMYNQEVLEGVKLQLKEGIEIKEKEINGNSRNN